MQMAVINILSPHVADMIAAGEVVERPGSVIKEMMENALDAGAKNITVELRGGGATYIRVTDDGCGMAPEDAGNCFLRHATSKLKDERGLEAISTMGFRGEALAAISAVSQVELVTRRQEDEAGTRVEVAAGDILDISPMGCPVGTTFTVRDLFYNTPARLKFMKSDRAEGANCVLLALRVALGRPDVSIRCVKDGKEEFFTPGDGTAASALYALLGRDVALSMLPVEGENEGVHVSGFVSSPSGGRGNRAMQYFFVNGRSIKSPILQAAVEQAYKNTLLVGRFPACALYIELNPGAVDVNVHPTKNEVKFSGEKKVFDGVHYSVINALRGEQHTLEMKLSAGTEKKLAPAAPEKPETPQTPTQTVRPANPVTYTPRPMSSRPASPMAVHSAQAGSGLSGGQRYVTMGRGSDGASVPKTYVITPPGARSDRPAASPVEKKAPAPVEVPEQTTLLPEEPAAPEQTLFSKPEPVPARMVGEVMKTYIVVDRGNAMLLIDKHAAHERMVFDRLKAQQGVRMSQALLTPETWRPAREDWEALTDNAALLEELGFALEPYGEEDVIVRGVPDTLDPAQTISALEEIAGKLRRGGGDLARDEVLQTISCKAAIKAGWDTDQRELQALVDKVVSGEIKYCPHGRPVAVALTRKELDKQFKRIV
jgi:DNA mismatch repair protein MutL